MQYVFALMLSALVALGAGQAGTQGTDPQQPTLRAVRFYRADWAKVIHEDFSRLKKEFQKLQRESQEGA